MAMTEAKMSEVKKIEDGDPAFPCQFHGRDSTGEVVLREQFVGMSLRDWFAGMAASGTFDNENPGRTAAWCYQIADALLEERKK